LGRANTTTEPVIWELLKLRSEQAKLMGFENQADYACVKRMSKTGQAALDFIDNLRTFELTSNIGQKKEALRRYVSDKTKDGTWLKSCRGIAAIWSGRLQTEQCEFLMTRLFVHISRSMPL
jgi:Zn-dependent oligopeptidase